MTSHHAAHSHPTDHGHDVGVGVGDGHDAGPGTARSDGGQGDVLDLDAEVVGHLGGLTAWARTLAACAPRRVLDLGAGTGTGTFALARRFPQAQVLAVDSSAAMLDRLRASAFALDLGTRVRTLQADLDGGLPDVGPVDLAWAASSLHHLRHPDRVLAGLREALEPGGTVVVVEMDGFPRFLPGDVGAGRPGLEDRLREVTAAQGWNAHPDWGPHLQAAGLELLERQVFSSVLDPAPPAAARYARRVLSGVRSRLADRLAEDDVRTLDLLLDDGAPGSLARRGDLVVRSTRTAWAARRA